MGALYASAIGTIVLRLREIPQRPASYDGKVLVYNTRHALRWESIGESPPTDSKVLDNAALEEALSHKAEFTEAEWAAFEVDELRNDAVVRSSTGIYFKPAAVDEATLRAALKRFGTIVSIDVSKSPAQVRFSTHEAARNAARSAAELTLE